MACHDMQPETEAKLLFDPRLRHDVTRMDSGSSRIMHRRITLINTKRLERRLVCRLMEIMKYCLRRRRIGADRTDALKTPANDGINLEHLV